MNNRHNARIAAMQLLFQSEMLGDWTEQGFARFFSTFYASNSMAPLEVEGQDFALRLVNTVKTYLFEIDQKIEGLQLSWSLQRMSRIDLSIIRLALAENKLNPELDVKIIINEAVNLAKEYAADDSHRFINAALDRALLGAATGALESTTNREVKSN